eukprot:1713920-Rhodomonas_salina.1
MQLGSAARSVGPATAEGKRKTGSKGAGISGQRDETGQGLQACSPQQGRLVSFGKLAPLACESD